MSIARSLDIKSSASWIGHPYFDVIDNSSDFENKICRMIAVIIYIIDINYQRALLIILLNFIGCLSKIGSRHWRSISNKFKKT